MDYILDTEHNIKPATNEEDDKKLLDFLKEELEAQRRMVAHEGDVLTVLPLRNTPLFPGVMMTITVSRPSSKKQVQSAFNNEKLMAILCQKDHDTLEPKPEDLYTMGVSGRIVRAFDLPDGSIAVIVEGRERIQVEEFTTTKQNIIKAKVHLLPENKFNPNDREFIAIVSNIKDQALKIVELSENTPSEAMMALKSIYTADSLINYVIVNFGIDVPEKQRLLAIDSIPDRAMKLLEILNKEVQMLEMKVDIQEKTREEINKDQREYFLHHQLETIQKELGNTNEEAINELKDRAKKKNLPDNVQKVFDENLKKLQRENPHSPDYSTVQNYLDIILDLPWNEYSEDKFDIRNAQDILERDHFGMEKVKERIIEYLAVMRQIALWKAEGNVQTDFKAPILCLYGPPGVGKTSLGKSIAEALGRKYARISLGGLHDEAEIRGHRKTYVGAMPGRIIESLRKVKTSNPVFVLDEIDKIGADYKGDPTSALLEVLDPEQNNTFHDNYLDIDYDLSKVLFIATANTLDTIPRPLLDRMELIELSGYLLEEKVEIAKRHLIPKELQNHGLKSTQLRFKKEELEFLIDHYTRESGVRSLERQIASICRKVVTKVALEETYNVSVTADDIKTYLGKPKYNRDEWETNKYIGVVTGLAWTQVGGEILFIETSLSPAKTPTLTLTGNLGDVMKESATIALAYIKAHADDFGIKRKDLDTMSVHMHVPEGAIPKDGPSAGITITTALVSAFTKRRVRPRVAMTGEMTLRGKVLPIGGVKEKILAAKRAGITDLVLCHENQKDVEEIPQKYLKGLTFHYMKDIREVIEFALLK